ALESGPSTLPLPHSYPSTFPSRWAGEAGGAGGVGWVTAAAPFAPTRDGGGAPTGESGVAPTIEPPIRPMTALGQFRDTFIIAIDDEGIAIVDQHVAHERVLFERITERLMCGPLESQRLLVPMLVDLPPAARQALTSHAADLERLGFELEEFGGGSVRVTAC